MAKFQKIIILNKEFQVINDQSEYIRSHKAEAFQIVKNLKYNTSASATTSTTSFLLVSTADGIIKTFNTKPSSFNVLPIQQQRLQVIKHLPSQTTG